MTKEKLNAYKSVCEAIVDLYDMKAQKAVFFMNLEEKKGNVEKMKHNIEYFASMVSELEEVVRGALYQFARTKKTKSNMKGQILNISLNMSDFNLVLNPERLFEDFKKEND